MERARRVLGCVLEQEPARRLRRKMGKPPAPLEVFALGFHQKSAKASAVERPSPSA